MVSRIIPPRSATATIIPAIGGASSSSDHSSALKSAFLVIRSRFDPNASSGRVRLGDGDQTVESAEPVSVPDGADSYPPGQTATHATPVPGLSQLSGLHRDVAYVEAVCWLGLADPMWSAEGRPLSRLRPHPRPLLCPAFLRRDGGDARRRRAGVVPYPRTGERIEWC